MGGEFIDLCKYCGLPVYAEPGGMYVESWDEEDDDFIAHGECYQQSGDDEGFVERLTSMLEENDDDKTFNNWSW